MAKAKITKAQREIYETLARSVEVAQERLALFLSTVLAGVGVTSGSVKEVTATSIVYESPENPEDDGN